MNYENWISYRYLTSSKGMFLSFLHFVSIAGVAVGVMALIVVTGVMTGFGNNLREKIIGTHPHILVEKETGIKNYNKLMCGIPGLVFIYNVHKYWMFNIVSHKSNEIGAVLIRALEPTDGINLMIKNRPVKKIVNLTNGPGKLTLALDIDKKLHKHMVTSYQGQIYVEDYESELMIDRSHRIGVKRDLEKQLRFFIHGNPFVSKI